MALGILVLITALAISAVAIYYSIAGLVAIFAAAALPIMIMGGALEIGKLVTAVWLHKYWEQAKWWLKGYLATAVVILMFITSMGIFGFLSKAHIEQTSAGTESVAQVERLITEIGRQEEIIVRAETKINALQTSGTGSDANIQNQIDKEQKRIDTAYDRIQPAIAEQNAIIANVTTLFQRELANIDASIANLQSYIDAGDIKKAQGMIGSKADGAYGPKTAAAFTAWTDAKKLERNEWIQKIQDAAQSDTIVSARKEISNLRDKADNQIAESNKLINRLRTQVGKTDKADEIDMAVDEQTLRIKNANAEIDLLTDEKYSLEGEYRKLEAEVGPIKYIAEFVYGESADKNMLEEAVRWVIIVIIFVFDPLAVLLLIASQYTFDFARKNRKEKKDDDDRINEKIDPVEHGPVGTVLPEEPVAETDATDRGLEQDEVQPDVPAEEVTNKVDIIDPPIEEVDADGDGLDDNTGQPLTGVISTTGSWATPPKKKVELLEESNDLDKWNKWVEAAEEEVTKETIDKRAQELASQEDDKHWNDAKRIWKDANPDQNIKDWKHAYVSGRIHELPWANLLQKEEGYIQNAEQTNDSVWQKITGNKTK